MTGAKDLAPHSPLPTSRAVTILAFDFGEKNIGVAVGDTETATAYQLALVSGAARMEKIEALVREWSPARLVVGLPLSLDGAEHQAASRARGFARSLASRFGLPVECADERLSSAAAEENLRERGCGGRKYKDLVHAEAARIILQSYLNERRASRR